MEDGVAASGKTPQPHIRPQSVTEVHPADVKHLPTDLRGTFLCVGDGREVDAAASPDARPRGVGG